MAIISNLTSFYTQIERRTARECRLAATQNSELRTWNPMTDVPKNLSFLTPTSVINLMESMSYLTHTHSPPFGRFGGTPHKPFRPAWYKLESSEVVL